MVLERPPFSRRHMLMVSDGEAYLRMRCALEGSAIRNAHVFAGETANDLASYLSAAALDVKPGEGAEALVVSTPFSEVPLLSADDSYTARLGGDPYVLQRALARAGAEGNSFKREDMILDADDARRWATDGR